MEFNQIPLLEAMTERMRWLSKNQEVLSANVANANTPGYTAKKLVGQDFRRLLENTSAVGARIPSPEPVRLAATAPGHLGPGGFMSRGFEEDDSPIYEETAAGNSVVLEDELRKVGQNDLDYGLVTNLYRKQTGLLKIAIGKDR